MQFIPSPTDSGGGWTNPVLIADETLSANTTSKAYTTLPNGNPFKFDKLTVDIINGESANGGWRTYWSSSVVTGNPTYGMANLQHLNGRKWDCHIEYVVSDDGLSVICHQECTPHGDDYDTSNQKGSYKRGLISSLDAITAWAWWSLNIYADTRIIIKGYNRI